MLKKGNDFIWQQQHSRDFQTIIQELCSLKLLKYYDSNKNLYLGVNASQKAIGMALLQSVVQDEHQNEAHGVHRVDAKIDSYENKPIPDDLLPVACGSRTLTYTGS